LFEELNGAGMFVKKMIRQIALFQDVENEKGTGELFLFSLPPAARGFFLKKPPPGPP
jgi:hypothetical protein